MFQRKNFKMVMNQDIVIIFCRKGKNDVSTTFLMKHVFLIDPQKDKSDMNINSNLSKDT